MATTVNIRSLLDAAVHFGHQTRRWNPKMKPYIFGDRNGIYIIDLKQTLLGLDAAYSFVSDLVANGGTLLFVGTKKQAQEAIALNAERCAMPFVNARWLGGMLTNFVTIRSLVTHMEDLEAKEADGRMAALPKKEQILLRKELVKLRANLNGVRTMKRIPQAIFVVDTKREEIAIHEAHRLGIPVIGVLDTNADPDDVNYGIPANDDAIRSVALLCEVVADAVVAGAARSLVSEAEMAAPAPASAGDAPQAAAPAPASDGTGAGPAPVAATTVDAPPPADAPAPAKGLPMDAPLTGAAAVGDAPAPAEAAAPADAPAPLPTSAPEVVPDRGSATEAAPPPATEAADAPVPAPASDDSSASADAPAPATEAAPAPESAPDAG
jgi:small subunit ribosomal protein S2